MSYATSLTNFLLHKKDVIKSTLKVVVKIRLVCLEKNFATNHWKMLDVKYQFYYYHSIFVKNSWRPSARM